MGTCNGVAILNHHDSSFGGLLGKEIGVPLSQSYTFTIKVTFATFTAASGTGHKRSLIRDNSSTTLSINSTRRKWSPAAV